MRMEVTMSNGMKIIRIYSSDWSLPTDLHPTCTYGGRIQLFRFPILPYGPCSYNWPVVTNCSKIVLQMH